MSTRYKTDGEKAGVKRRSATYRQRLRDTGLKPREVWSSDAEIERVKALLADWRGKGWEEIEAAGRLLPR